MFNPGALTASRLAALGILGALAPVGLTACGGSNKPAASPAVVVSSPVVKEAPPDLSPVAAPPELIALARFKTPATAIETVSSWANFPFKIQSALSSELKGLDGVIAWDAPVEAAMALDPDGEGKLPEPLSVLSIGLTSLDGALEFAKSHGQAVHKLRAGVYRVGDSDDVSCSMSAALGSAAARLVCGHRAHDVDGLINYATRGLPNESLPNVDFQLELRLAPVKQKYGAELGSARLFAGLLLREVQIDNPRFDRALSDVTYGLVDEALALAHDLDKVRLDATIDRAKNQLNLRFQTKFDGRQSWLVQAAAETIPMMAPAPEDFWQLPADVSSASYTVGWKPGRLKPLGRSLGELLDAFMEAEKLPAPLRSQGSKALEGLFDLNTNLVRAEGSLTALPSDPLLAAEYRLFGWYLTELPGDPKPVLSVFDGLNAVLASRDLPKVLKQKFGLDPKVWPQFSSHAVTLKNYKPGAKVYKIDLPREMLQAMAGKSTGRLGEFSTALAQPAVKGKPVTKSVPVSILVASDGEHTFIGASPDENALIKRLESLKDKKTATVQALSGLEALKLPHAGGGFFTLRRLASLLSGVKPSETPSTWLDALPQHGDTPILLTSDPASDGAQSTMSITVPRAAIADLGALIPILVVASSGAH